MCYQVNNRYQLKYKCKLKPNKVFLGKKNWLTLKLIDNLKIPIYSQQEKSLQRIAIESDKEEKRKSDTMAVRSNLRYILVV